VIDNLDYSDSGRYSALREVFNEISAAYPKETKKLVATTENEVLGIGPELIERATLTGDALDGYFKDRMLSEIYYCSLDRTNIWGAKYTSRYADEVIKASYPFYHYNMIFLRDIDEPNVMSLSNDNYIKKQIFSLCHEFGHAVMGDGETGADVFAYLWYNKMIKNQEDRSNIHIDSASVHIFKDNRYYTSEAVMVADRLIHMVDGVENLSPKDIVYATKQITKAYEINQKEMDMISSHYYGCKDNPSKLAEAMASSRDSREYRAGKTYMTYKLITGEFDEKKTSHLFFKNIGTEDNLVFFSNPADETEVKTGTSILHNICRKIKA